MGYGLLQPENNASKGGFLYFTARRIYMYLHPVAVGHLLTKIGRVSKGLLCHSNFSRCEYANRVCAEEDFALCNLFIDMYRIVKVCHFCTQTYVFRISW